MIKTYEKFFDKIKILRSQTSQVHYVSIPKKLLTALGLKKGDEVKIMIQKNKDDLDVD